MHYYVYVIHSGQLQTGQSKLRSFLFYIHHFISFTELLTTSHFLTLFSKYIYIYIYIYIYFQTLC